MNQEKLASIIDHTNLKPYATSREIDVLCYEAVENKFSTVCVYGYWVDYIRELHPDLRITQVVNFPTGLSMSHVETLSQINSCADEYDIVMNISKLREKKYREVAAELKQVRSYVGDKILKVIVESAVLTSDELVMAISILADAKSDFIKTSTGYVSQTDMKLVDQVATIRSYLNLHRLPMGIKASGGIRTLEQVRTLVGLGVTRIGTSSALQILDEMRGYDK